MEITEREKEVLELLQQGSSNKEISASLGISVNTVKFHLNKLYRKMGVNSRMQILAELLHSPVTEN